MKKPTVICYMMTSIDGRIDCPMTEHLPGVEDYYKVMKELNFDANLNGKTTAELELALKGKFKPKTNQKAGKICYSKKTDSKMYDIITDTTGTLLWKKDSTYENPHIIITSENVSMEYLDYLDMLNMSWIVCGKTSIDFAKACEILATEFKVQRLGVTGGAKINTAFLEAGLLDEIDLLIGAGIDGRGSYPTFFDGLKDTSEVKQLKLKQVKTYESQAVLLSYEVLK